MEKTKPKKIRTRDLQIGGSGVELKAALNEGYETPSIIAFTLEISVRCVHCDVDSALEKFANAIVSATGQVQHDASPDSFAGQVWQTRRVIDKLIEDIKE